MAITVGLQSRFRVSVFGFRVSVGPGEVKSSESVSGFGFRVSQFETNFNSRFRVSGFGFRVSLVETNSADLSPDHVSHICIYVYYYYITKYIFHRYINTYNMYIYICIYIYMYIYIYVYIYMYWGYRGSWKACLFEMELQRWPLRCSLAQEPKLEVPALYGSVPPF